MLSFNKKIAIASLIGGALMVCHFSSANAGLLPPPAVDERFDVASSAKETSIVVAGGCFWGVQSVFQHVKGVRQAISGYAGGSEATAHYGMVGSGTTGHAESVKVVYDPSQVTLGTILQVFFSVAHDPTQLNSQGPDHGTQYRSAIFFANPEQQRIARAYILQLDDAKAFPRPIVTKLEPLQGFYPAEGYHQDYARLHPDNPYIKINDAPKVAALQREAPQLLKETQ